MLEELLDPLNVCKPVLEKISMKPHEIALICHDIPWFSYLKSPADHDDEQYSFIGLSPFIVLKSIDPGPQGLVEIKLVQENKAIRVHENPFDVLRNLLDRFQIKESFSDIPFIAGGIGYLAYDLVHFIEKLPLTQSCEVNIPNAVWVFYDVLYIYDHHKSEGYLSAIDYSDHPEQKAIQKAKDKISLWQKLLAGRFLESDDSDHSILTPQKALSQGKTNLSKVEYLTVIHKIKEYIKKGDIYQANFTYRYYFPYRDNPYHLFQSVSKDHPTPFSAYLNDKDFQILSFSPERLVKCTDRNILVQPMKGTRPRGKSLLEDEKLKAELLNSEKDGAELLMIVDLLRNDLGKVSDFGSVVVEKLKNIEAYPSVYQLTSRIVSRLSLERSLIDLIKAVFPSGSITGCPKIRAMEVLSSLERKQRSIFMGSIGYISFHNTLDLNVAIRTSLIKDNTLYFQVGGGIIHDSDPEKEYQETIDKSVFLLSQFTKD